MSGTSEFVHENVQVAHADGAALRVGFEQLGGEQVQLKIEGVLIDKESLVTLAATVLGTSLIRTHSVTVQSGREKQMRLVPVLPPTLTVSNQFR